MERRLERIHARARRADRLARAAGAGDRGGLLRQERRARRWPSARPAAWRCWPPPSAASPASPTRRRRSRWPSAAPAPPARTRSSGWSAPCSACPSRRPPTTPPTRSRWRSATAAATGRREAVAERRAPAATKRRRPAGGRMIAAVRGEVLVRRPDHVVIDAAGVGYRLAVSSETLKAVPAAGSETFLHAELIAREDSLALYGFASEEERDLFRLLISVSGVGPKVGDRDALRRQPARAAAGDRRRRRQTLPGGARDRQADRRADHRRAAREGRRRARGRGRRSPPPRSGDARALARDGLVNLGYPPLEAEQLLDGPRGRRRRGAARRRPAQGRGGPSERRRSDRRRPDIGASRIRTPGIDDRAGPDRRRGARPRRPRRRPRRGPRPLACARRPWPTSSTRRRSPSSWRSSSRPPAAAASRSTTSCSPARPGSARPRSPTSSPPSSGVPLVQTAGPGARAQGRRRLLPHLAGARQRLLHRRDPPARPRGRGDALPGDGGRRAAGRARPGRRRAHRHPAAAALHAGRRDHPRRPADDAAARPLRRLPPPRALRRPSTWRRSSSARPGSSRSRSTPRARTRSPPARAARRASPTGC